MKTILAPIDFSGVSGAVVAEASSLARACGGRVVLLTVVQPTAITSEFAPMPDDLAAALAAGERNVAANLGKIADELTRDSIPNETVQLNGAPVANIVDQAQKFQADHIVMGSHGHTAVYDLLVGSTTHGVLKRARCPVVIVPPAKTKPGKN